MELDVKNDEDDSLCSFLRFSLLLTFIVLVLKKKKPFISDFSL